MCCSIYDYQHNVRDKVDIHKMRILCFSIPSKNNRKEKWEDNRPPRFYLKKRKYPLGRKFDIVSQTIDMSLENSDSESVSTLDNQSATSNSLETIAIYKELKK